MLLLLALPACEQPLRRRADSDRPDQRFTGLRLAGYEEGRLKFRLRAPEAELREKTSEFRASRFRLTVYREGRPQAEVEARQGWMDTQAYDLRAEGEVRVVSLTNGSTLYAEELRWVQGERLYKSSGAVRHEKPGEIVRGRGLEANEDLTRVTIFHNVHVRRRGR